MVKVGICDLVPSTPAIAVIAVDECVYMYIVCNIEKHIEENRS